MYFNEMLPRFTAIRETAQEIIRINQENMVEADNNARAKSARSTRYMILAVLGGLGMAIFFADRLQRSILTPIRAVTTVSKELGEGNLDQVVPVESKDELGQLADAFNKLATKLRAYRQVTSDQLLQARLMTEITFSAFPDPIIALSPEGFIDFTNPAANRLFTHLDTKNALPAAIQTEVDRVLKGGEDYLPTSFAKAICLRVADQETFILPRVIGMREENGTLFGAAVILQDVTRLRLLDEVKNNLVSTVSHELKTPLTSVRMGLHLLLEERIGSLNPKQTELLLAAREDSERLLRMINDLLDLAKLESGETGLLRTDISSRQILDSAASEARELVTSRGLHLKVDAAPNLPAISVDPQQIAHVFSNLVSNALKYTKAGDEIKLQAAVHDAMVRFSVIDHGPGIAPEHQTKLFDRFFRVPGSESSGAGLGLAIAKQIVTAHGGRIGIHSQPGQGSEFYFDLPQIATGTKT
jgi:signal transduction histidine kinase